MKGGFPFLRKLADPNHALTKLVAGVMTETNHREFFEGKGHAIYVEYVEEKSLKVPTPPPITGK